MEDLWFFFISHLKKSAFFFATQPFGAAADRVSNMVASPLGQGDIDEPQSGRGVLPCRAAANCIASAKSSSVGSTIILLSLALTHDVTQFQAYG
jgi:hypothetical protein